MLHLPAQLPQIHTHPLLILLTSLPPKIPALPRLTRLIRRLHSRPSRRLTLHPDDPQHLPLSGPRRRQPDPRYPPSALTAHDLHRQAQDAGDGARLQAGTDEVVG